MPEIFCCPLEKSVPAAEQPVIQSEKVRNRSARHPDPHGKGLIFLQIIDGKRPEITFVFTELDSKRTRYRNNPRLDVAMQRCFPCVRGQHD
jgi:hypothetical protein